MQIFTFLRKKSSIKKEHPQILFFVPNWKKPSEFWLHRMIQSIKPHVSGVLCPKPQSSFWIEGIPSFSTEAAINVILRMAIKLFHLTKLQSIINEKHLLAILNSKKHDIIYIHFATVAVQYCEILKKTNKPIYVHCHGYDVTWDLMSPANPAVRVHSEDYMDKVKQLERDVVFIANSKHTLSILKGIGISNEKVRLHYFGIQASPARVENFNSRELSILYLGRLIDCKGPEVVMKAFDNACKKGLNAHLKLVGDGPLRITCELLKKELSYGDNISILGEVDWESGQKLMREADIFTAHNRKGPLTNQEEAFGVSIVEAMAAGIPVITGRNGGCIETVIHNETGLLVEPGDIEAHSEAFVLLGNNPELRNKMGEKGRERVKLYFSPELERERFLEIYDVNTLNLGS